MNGLFSETLAYYDTVEQQGHLTLHLHIIIWIKYSLSPQQIRDRLLAGDSEFQKQLIQYLESAHKGEYFTGSQADVFNMRHETEMMSGFIDYTKVLPEVPAPHCKHGCGDCLSGETSEGWWAYFRKVVGILICKCNIHMCCMDNKWKQCKARFPCQIFNETSVDTTTGHLNMLKRERWLNTFTPILTYLFRCNTDVTSLRSGMAIKAVLIYVTDYITKPGLKTHAIFDCIQSVFQRSKDQPDNPAKTRKERARKTMAQMVNVLGAKTELGSPMVCSYLLGLPDHYMN
ncbi:hypothetical protein ARMGADRAFT_927965 [Armillaria gallica]|uniref:Helitron helicase-like domain-containing protein n=1 Tax=Armillaria gallica TaxID=47427 RepID=A0A2H3DGU4_ARMGA|nr:hypothetical protein ARMGADRAFT_927965 [Armillaria gallica]